MQDSRIQRFPRPVAGGFELGFPLVPAVRSTEAVSARSNCAMLDGIENYLKITRLKCRHLQLPGWDLNEHSAIFRIEDRY
jgi:hypothetical protein